jgi:cell division septation protein DedD
VSASGTFQLFDDTVTRFLTGTDGFRSLKREGVSVGRALQEASQRCVCPVGTSPGDDLPLTTTDFTNVINGIITNADERADLLTTPVINVEEVTNNSTFPTSTPKGEALQTTAPSTTRPSTPITSNPSAKPTPKPTAKPSGKKTSSISSVGCFATSVIASEILCLLHR